jgi:hypothetical protein
MAKTRIPGTFIDGNNYEVTVSRPYDARMLVPTYADLIIKDNWRATNPDTGELTNAIIAYNGMIVVVADKTDMENSGLYILMDYNAKKTPNVELVENWIKIGDADLTAVEERLTALESLPKGVTLEQVEAQLAIVREEIAALDYLTESDLEGYATTDIVSAGFADVRSYVDEQLANCITEESLASKLVNYVTSDAFEFYKVEIEDFKKSVEEELASKASATDLADINSQIAEVISSLDDKLEQSDLNAYYTRDEIDGKAFATQSYVDDKVAEAVSGGQIDLSGYVKTERLNEVHASIVTEIGSVNATVGEVDDKVNDLANEVDTDIKNLQGFVQNSVAEVAASVGELGSNIDDVAGRVKELEELQIVLIHGGSAPVAE